MNGGKMDKRNIIAERLTQALNKKKWKQADVIRATEPFCKKYNVKLSKSDISQYIRGQREPSASKMSILSKALGVNESWLAGQEDSAEQAAQSCSNIKPISSMHSIPIVGEVTYGQPILAMKSCNKNIEIPDSVCASFALYCKGNSMIDIGIHDGDYVLIHKQNDVNDGDIAAVIIEHEATLKRIYKFSDYVILQPVNTKYKPQIYLNEQQKQIQILGKAIACLMLIN